MLSYSVDIFFHYGKVKVFVGLTEMSYFKARKKSEHLGPEPYEAVQTHKTGDCWGKTGMNETGICKM